MRADGVHVSSEPVLVPGVRGGACCKERSNEVVQFKQNQISMALVTVEKFGCKRREGPGSPVFLYSFLYPFSACLSRLSFLGARCGLPFSGVHGHRHSRHAHEPRMCACLEVNPPKTSTSEMDDELFICNTALQTARQLKQSLLGFKLHTSIPNDVPAGS